MAKMITSVEEELTPEGKRLWDNIANFEKLAAGISLLPIKPKKLPKLNLFEVELYFVRTELRRMIKNSEKVIRECEVLIGACKTREEYLSCEARVAKYVHQNLIIRLTNILDGKPAFEHDIYVDDEEPRPYSNINKKQREQTDE